MRKTAPQTLWELCQISVPGAIDALLQNGKLVIQASTGFLWEVDPDTGARKRISGQPAT